MGDAGTPAAAGDKKRADDVASGSKRQNQTCGYAESDAARCRPRRGERGAGAVVASGAFPRAVLRGVGLRAMSIGFSTTVSSRAIGA